MADLRHNHAFDAWVADARAVPLVAHARQIQPRLRCTGSEWVGPCPSCGGNDRFSVSIRKNVWHCRKAGRGGDVIALVQYVEDLDFIAACARLTGRPAPGRDDADETPEERAERERRLAARADAVNREAARQARVEADYRRTERNAAWQIWDKARREIAGTPADAYLRLRGLAAPRGAHLRFRADHTLWRTEHDASGRKRYVSAHSGPALIAGIIAPDGHFAGVHQTWIDLSDPGGKARVADPKTGEIVPAKKVRGSVHGGRIELVRVEHPTRMIVGEGIETCLSAYLALVWANSPLVDGMAVWSSVSLGNLCGRALDRVRHPTITITDSLNRVRRKLVPGTQPDPASVALPIPESVTELWLLGDGDSDPFETEVALRRAQARYRVPGRTVRIAWAERGQDFNDMLRGASASPADLPAAAPALRGAA
ncbi:CHC2 zinc finger domain-containing protein [Methylobacterium sp. CCH5-D2]|uniref:DUF7146 domain-containing protein n=1 Tax=Methylobacterium sp. CCH5-D2 TaxID=1768765 RepID=UPI00082F7D48|nr:CHC2 zinc finger domain-containing protein [Methylobacterium sp. CCH5-D2]